MTNDLSHGNNSAPIIFNTLIDYVSIYSLCTACEDQNWVQLPSVDQVEFF